MPANPPDNMRRITPNIFYDDPASALEWLAKAFGFETRMSMPGPDGAIMHAEMQVADAAIMMSPTSATKEWKSPKSLAGSVTQGLYVYVDDLDAHCAVGWPIITFVHSFRARRCIVAHNFHPARGHDCGNAGHPTKTDGLSSPPACVPRHMPRARR